MKYLFILFLFVCFGCSSNKRVLDQDYFLPGPDEQTIKITQSNDTFCEINCNNDLQVLLGQSYCYKIQSFKKKSNLYILTFKNIASNLFSSRDTTFEVQLIRAFIKEIDKNRLGISSLSINLIEPERADSKINWDSVGNKFFFTLYSKKYVDYLLNLKPIKNLSDAEEIIYEGKKYLPLLEKYIKSPSHDIYEIWLNAEFITRVCINKGFNPIGAGQTINSLMRKKELNGN
jgi:hypothetical protein